METIPLLGLPEGSIVRGHLYADASEQYGLGDVLEVELPNGLHVDLGWDESETTYPFGITVWREYFGDWLLRISCREPGEAAQLVSAIANIAQLCPDSLYYLPMIAAFGDAPQCRNTTSR